METCPAISRRRDFGVLQGLGFRVPLGFRVLGFEGLKFRVLLETSLKEYIGKAV